MVSGTTGTWPCTAGGSEGGNRNGQKSQSNGRGLRTVLADLLNSKNVFEVFLKFGLYLNSQHDEFLALKKQREKQY